jgi:uncharacterized protein with GYD domain
MPRYISLINWTEQGIQNVGDTVARGEQARDAMARLGVRIEALYWTVGPYDIVAIVEADDDESATAALLALAKQGNVRSTTMQAFDAKGMGRILAKLG